MTEISSLPPNQEVGFFGRVKVKSLQDGAVSFSSNDGTSFTSIGFAGGGFLLPPQTTASPPTLTEFPDDGCYGIHHNSASKLTNWYYNVSGTIYAAQSDGLFHNPLSLYDTSDGTDFALCFNRTMRAMETFPSQKAGVMVVPRGTYTFESPVDLPQTSHVDYKKARLLFDFSGCSIKHTGFNGPLFQRTAGTPEPDSLLYTFRNGHFSGVLANNPYEHGTIELDTDVDPYGFIPNVTQSAFKLDKADGAIFHDFVCGGMHAFAHLIGCRHITMSNIKAEGLAMSLYAVPDGDGRICKNIHQVRCRHSGGMNMGAHVWLEEVDDFKSVGNAYEGSASKSRTNIVWKCNDNTSCKRLVTEQTWDEHTSGSEDIDLQRTQEHVWVQNKAEDAVVVVDGMYGIKTSLVRYADQGVGNLVVVVKNNHMLWDSRIGAVTVSDSSSTFENAGWSYVPQWDALKQYSLGEFAALIYDDIQTDDVNDAIMTFQSVGVPVIGEKPAIDWNTNLSGNTLDYYPLGTKVYYKGQYFTSNTATPSSAPTLSTTTADWTFVGAANWRPVGQRAILSVGPTYHERNVSQNPKATNTGGLTAMMYDLHGLPPLLHGTSRMFDNCTVPAGYIAEGYEAEGTYQYVWWRVMNGTEVS